MMKANVRGDRRITPATYHLLGFNIINEQVNDFMRSERRDHLQIDLLDLRHPVRPRLRILGPTQPGRIMWMPLGRHVEAEGGGSVCPWFSHRVFQSGEL